MKKLLTLCALLFLAFTVKAQTADETLEWLRTKQSTIKNVTSENVEREGNFKIGDVSLTLSAKEKSTTIEWSKVKDVRVKFMDITIVSSDLVDGKNIFINLMIDASIAPKYAKALKHLATLKGAKMVRDDMFN